MTRYPALLALTVLAAASPARAYRTGADVPSMADTERVRWADSQISYFIDSSSIPEYLTIDSVETAVWYGLQAWEQPLCTDVDFYYYGLGSPPASGDGFNTIAWELDSWSAAGLPDDAFAITDVAYAVNGTGDWEIVEFDILLNGVDYHWTVDSGEAVSGDRSLRAALAHEGGHALGLLHVCEVDGADGAPLCAIDPYFDESVMYPSYLGPEQATLGEDDADGVCFLYPSPPCDPSCANGEICARGQCVVECNGVLCGPGLECRDGYCATSCADASCSDPCASDGDCRASSRCVDGRCTLLGGELGDPCATDDACHGGICIGYCTHSCISHCPFGYQCLEADGSQEPAPVPVCTAIAGVLGDACAESADCASAICLTSEDSDGLCTRACQPSTTACPPEYECTLAGGRHVCVPQALLPPGSCSVPPHDARVHPSALLSVFLLLCVAIGSSRLGRRSRTPSGIPK